MVAIRCEHKDAIGARTFCEHLLQFTNPEVDEAYYYVWFHDRSTSYALICLDCRKDLESARPKLVAVCPECFNVIEKYGWCDNKDGVIDFPVVPERDAGLRFEHQTERSFANVHEDILDIKPIESSPDTMWIAISSTRAILQFDSDTGHSTELYEFDEEQWSLVVTVGTRKRDTETEMVTIERAEVVLAGNIKLYVSHAGDFAAVVNNKGGDGLVINLLERRLTMKFSRSEYHHGVTPFPVAFFERDGKAYLVHGSGWNMLDISDPQTGQELTKREYPEWKKGDPRPEHYLDYFHSTLSVSPDQERIAEWGWAWSPVGSIRTWSLKAWLDDNPWESEDGGSRKHFEGRNYYWDGPMCWVDNRTLAIWGYGKDDYCLIPAVSFYDVETGERSRWFVGPMNYHGGFIFDRWLYSFSTKYGVEIWDIVTAERLLHDADFVPTAYHQRAKCFITLLPEGRFRVSRLVEA
jgi:hypothetical protein